MFYIVEKETGKGHIKKGGYGTTMYETERGAKIVCSKLNKEEAKDKYIVVDVEVYRELYPVKMVERVNLMTGQKYMEAEDTPNCCSPASETYWSM